MFVFNLQDTAYYIATHSNVTGRIACGLILQMECAHFDESTNWTVNVDVGSKPAVEQPKINVSMNFRSSLV